MDWLNQFIKLLFNTVEGNEVEGTKVKSNSFKLGLYILFLIRNKNFSCNYDEFEKNSRLLSYVDF